MCVYYNVVGSKQDHGHFFIKFKHQSICLYKMPVYQVSPGVGLNIDAIH